MTREQFAFDELDARAAEDARFPVPPDPMSEDWAAYALARRDRAGRRKAMGYSRASADMLVAWAMAREHA
jgi:hypothetical protein